MNLFPVQYKITKDDRIKRNKHKSAVLWFTGLSASGKTTIANAVESELFEMGHQVISLDADNIRSGLNKDLDFSEAGRTENIRRISEVAKLFSDTGYIVTTAFISPFSRDRELARNIIGKNFIEIYCNASFDTCAKRDPKGLYKKALNNEIPNFTGLTSPYEVPEDPEIILYTDKDPFDLTDTVRLVIDYLKGKNITINPTVLDDVKNSTLVFDFDGVIHKYSKGYFESEEAYDPPMEGSIESLTKLKDMGFRIHIMSSRPAHQIKKWLVKYNMEHLIEDVSNTKVVGAVYLDDRGYHFTTWERAMEDLFNHPKLKFKGKV